jgi:PAS domain S-box-containing protein
MRQIEFNIRSSVESIMEHLPVLFWIVDESFVVLYFNNSFKRWMKITDDQLGCTIDNFFPAANIETHKEHNNAAFLNGSSTETIEEWIDLKGYRYVHKVHRFPVKDEQGKTLLGLYAVDITQQVQFEQELSTSNKRFQYVSRVASEVIWDWDIESDKVYRGDAYFKMTGFKECTYPMKAHIEQIHVKDRKRIVKSLQEALSSIKSFWHEEYKFLCKDGTYHEIIDNAYIVRGKDGKPAKMIGAMDDVSLSRRLEKELVEKEEAKKKEIIKAIIEAQEKERTQISYELHEHLSQNLATCKLLLDGLNLPESREEENIRLRSSMKLLHQTMNEIRSMSQQLNASAIRMVGLMGVMRDFTSNINLNSQVEVHLQCEGFTNSTALPKDIEVSVFRIFQEGLSNVIRHSGATQATVQLTKRSKRLILAIHDNGKGFDTSKTHKGLGFTNIINRADYHNGTVSINSTKGEGCSLEVMLPITNNSNYDK